MTLKEELRALAAAAAHIRETGEMSISDPHRRSTVWTIPYWDYRDLLLALDLPGVKEVLSK